MHDLSDPLEIGKVSASVENIRIHPDWNPSTSSYDSDIAVIDLRNVVQFSQYIQPICLITHYSQPTTIDTGYVVGYGKSRVNLETTPTFMTSPILDKRFCVEENKLLDQLLSPRSFCGGYANGTGACSGDSGSGLFVLHDGTFYLRGIVSASLLDALNECNVNTRTIFTDVIWFYNWITTGVLDVKGHQ